MKTTEVMEKMMNYQQNKIEKISTAKDKAFEMIQDLKVVLTQIQKNITAHDWIILKNRDSSTEFGQSVTETKTDHRLIYEN